MNVAPLSQSAMTSLTTSNLNAQQYTLQQLQEQLSSNQNINAPSDNPSGFISLMSIGASSARVTQFQSNATDGASIAQIANGALTSAVAQLQSARTTILQAGSSGTSATAASGMAQSLQGVYNSLQALANTSFEGYAVFGGTSGGTSAYDSAGNYVGSNKTQQRSVAPGVSLPVAVTSPFGASGSASNVFTVLSKTISDLNAGNLTAVTGSDLTSFDAALNQTIGAASTQGTYFDQLQSAQSSAQSTLTDLQTQYGNIQTVNLAQVTTQYSQQMSDYQIALQAAAKVVQPTLASFI